VTTLYQTSVGICQIASKGWSVGSNPVPFLGLWLCLPVQVSS